MCNDEVADLDRRFIDELSERQIRTVVASLITGAAEAILETVPASA